MTDKQLLEKVVKEACGNIRSPMTLRQILEKMDSCEYNSELLLRHAILRIRQLMK